MKTVTVIAEDRVALLADISYVLGKSNVNIDGLNVEIVGGKAVISLSVRDPKKARDILQRNGYNTVDMGSIVIKVTDHVSGGMARITERLTKAKVHIENLSMLSSSASEGVFALQVDKPRKAAKVLWDAVLLNQNSSYA